ncbi:Rieske 2Fe-2S domain-containing protein [Saccharothrix obliqua]|uniref:Rieske 2Fe-2S domain-containing protein n=1 Tax=Saccharothrix obliqua TaxID=2861747 RepID=UPI001C5E30C7|nr:Rieske 2Fe-2S domain-containing protein [Saccharothrix obliqua]MBW4721451.1 Rieske 2Fe-2S domain-containing protein [Saccharothrix obliqua]
MSLPDESAPRRRLVTPPPAEGADGLFSQTWYPICLSDELTGGKPVGVDFLGGRVVVFRGPGGRAQVLSAYCVHVGADLSVGEVVDDRLRCRFHHWSYDVDGRCTGTGIGDPVPEGARLFRFPTAEKYGVVWAFNGLRPLFELPDLPHPADRLVLRASAFPRSLPSDPWVITAQTLDLQHFSQQHEFGLLTDPSTTVRRTAHSMGCDLDLRLRDGADFRVRADIHGTNIYWQTGTLDGRWFCWITGVGLPRPQESVSTFICGTVRGDDDDEAQRFLDTATGVMMSLLDDDAAVLSTIHYRPGLLTESDETLRGFLDYLNGIPRAHPSADFLS